VPVRYARAKVVVRGVLLDAFLAGEYLSAADLEFLVLAMFPAGEYVGGPGFNPLNPEAQREVVGGALFDALPMLQVARCAVAAARVMPGGLERWTRNY
jgi:hypothetical protein